MGRKRTPSEIFQRIDTTPIDQRPVLEHDRWRRPPIDLYERSRQTYCYHTCQTIAAGWGDLQNRLNQLQCDFEELYGPFVELVNVYRRNNTKDGGICIVAIFKIGPFMPSLATAPQPQGFAAWWAFTKELIRGRLIDKPTPRP